MGCAFGSRAALMELRRRQQFANACVPPWRPDLRPDGHDPSGAWMTFAQVLRGLLHWSPGPAHRGLKPETRGR
jgi:hypothetical protein